MDSSALRLCYLIRTKARRVRAEAGDLARLAAQLEELLLESANLEQQEVHHGSQHCEEAAESHAHVSA